MECPRGGSARARARRVGLRRPPVARTRACSGPFGAPSPPACVRAGGPGAGVAGGGGGGGSGPGQPGPVGGGVAGRAREGERRERGGARGGREPGAMGPVGVTPAWTRHADAGRPGWEGRGAGSGDGAVSARLPPHRGGAVHL